MSLYSDYVLLCIYVYMYTSSLLQRPHTAPVVQDTPQGCSRDPADDDNRHNQFDFFESVDCGGAE